MANQDPDWLLLQDLNFGLSDINGLSTIQLCLVQFHPEADDVAKSKAELAYWRRRNKAQARAKAQALQPAETAATSSLLRVESKTATIAVTPPVAPTQATDIPTKVSQANDDESSTVKRDDLQEGFESERLLDATEIALPAPSCTPAIGAPVSNTPDAQSSQSIEAKSKVLETSSRAVEDSQYTINLRLPASVPVHDAAGPAEPIPKNNLIPAHTKLRPESAIIGRVNDKEGSSNPVRTAQNLSNAAARSLPAPLQKKRALHLETAIERRTRILLTDRQYDYVLTSNNDREDGAHAETGKRKRSTTPQLPELGEPLPNHPKTSRSTYDRFANQRRSPSPVHKSTEDFRVVTPDDRSVNGHKHAPKLGRKGTSELLPAACTQALVCVFVGNMPNAAKDSEVRQWVFSSRSIPRPVIVTKLASARTTTDGHQYIRVFFKHQSEAKNAVGILRKTPFGEPPVQLVIRALEKKAGKLKLYWRDVESWAHSYLEDMVAGDTKSSSDVKKEQSLSREPPQQPQQREPLPHLLPARPLSRQNTTSQNPRYEADRLADRIGIETRRYDRYEPEGGRPLSERALSSSSFARDDRQDNKEHGNSLARRVREPDTYYTSAHDRSTREAHRRYGSNDIYRRFDASPPRRRRSYSPSRCVGRPRGQSEEDRNNLLGRLK